jgi:hypothetical protein
MPEDYRNGTTTLLRDRKKASFSGENAVCYIMTRGNISYAAGTGSRAGANTPRAAPQSKVVIIPLLLESGSHAGTAVNQAQAQDFLTLGKCEITVTRDSICVPLLIYSAPRLLLKSHCDGRRPCRQIFFQKETS